MSADVLPPLLTAARALVERRLGLRLAAHQDVNLGAVMHELSAESQPPDSMRVLERLSVDPVSGVEWQRIVARVTVGETSFFRHREWFDAIEACVLAPLVASRRQNGRRSLAVWSVGCANGEEPYTLAIILSRMLPDLKDWSVLIRASDINGEALDRARRGQYRDWSMRELDDSVRARFFSRSEKTFQLNGEIREMVRFDLMNLADPAWTPPPPEGFDLILCRNVLMYFPVESQRRIAACLSQTLSPEGWLAVSPAEASAELFQNLQIVNLPDAILFRRDRAASGAIARPSAGLVPKAERPEVLSARRAPGNEYGWTALLERARRLADEGRHGEAQGQCEAALSLDPLSSEGYALLATIRAEAGDLDAAVHAARQSLYLKPGCPDVSFLLAGLLMRTNKRVAGVRLMHQVLADLGDISDMAVVRSTDGLTAGAMRELVRSALSEPWSEDEIDVRPLLSRL